MNPIPVTQDRYGAPGSSDEAAAQLVALVRRRFSHLGAEEASEVVQETYRRWLAFDRRDAVRDPQGYLIRIASRVVIDRRSAHDRDIITYDSDLAHQRAERWADRGMDATERSLDIEKVISEALAQMPEKLRQPLQLKLGMNLHREEIASALGLTVQTVRTYLADGLRFCRDMIRQHLGEDP